MSKKSSFVVMGSTGGIGSAVCRKLVTMNSQLLLCGRDTEKLTNLSKATGMPWLQSDTTNSEQVATCFEKALDLYGKVDGVVNCVGSLLLKPAHLTSEQELEKTLSLNIGTAFNTVRSGAKAMLKNGGSIVLISSAAARVGLINHEAIATAKAGIIGLTLSAAATYAKNNIRVNAVAPGLVKTAMTERLTANQTMEQASVAMHALDRLGNPEDIANMITWLLGPEQSWVTGQVFGVDGGLATLRPRVKV